MEKLSEYFDATEDAIELLDRHRRLLFAAYLHTNNPEDFDGMIAVCSAAALLKGKLDDAIEASY